EMQAHLSVVVLVGMQNRREVSVRRRDQVRTAGKIARPVSRRARLEVEASGPPPTLAALPPDPNAPPVPRGALLAIETDDRARPQPVQLEVGADEARRSQLGPRLPLVGRVAVV